MSNIEQELSQIRTKVQAAEKAQAVAESRRETAKADLKAALQKAADEYGVKTIPELEQKIDDLRKDRDAKMDALRAATNDL